MFWIKNPVYSVSKNWPAALLMLARKLSRDTSGNAMMLVAAAVVPLLAIIGGGIDLGRSYLAESRLQQACDAGTLAARKQLGAAAVISSSVPPGVANTGNKFFNINYRSGMYGTRNRNFVMTLESDYSISGDATVDVPTTIMRIFSFDDIKLHVTCQAKLNFNNTDIMMVLDTTGSMNDKALPADANTKLVTMKNVIRSFHKQVELAKAPGIRVRYGIVPFSTNVNVGALLDNNWVVSNWHYQSRELRAPGSDPATTYSWYENWSPPTGPVWKVIDYSWAAVYHPAVTEADQPYYTCDNRTIPTGNHTVTNTQISPTVSTPWAGPPAGTKTVQRMRWVENGNAFYVVLNGSQCDLHHDTFISHTYEADYVTIPYQQAYYNYASLPKNVANWRTETMGCMEERDTYEIDDYTNIDFTRALDLDIRMVPTADDRTKWRPMYPNIIYERNIDPTGVGTFSFPPTISPNLMAQPGQIPSMISCPAPAKRLIELPLNPANTNTDLDNYLSAIIAEGTTYPDIGMIWGGRLLTSFGLFSADNADVSPDRPTRRQLIFLTDGQTEAYDIAYGAYGVEPLDRRRWNNVSPAGGLSLTNVVERRFGVACEKVKADNITIWVIGFGTTVTPLMQQCAGAGHWFQANDAAQLTAIFNKLAGSMGDLRISK